MVIYGFFSYLHSPTFVCKLFQISVSRSLISQSSVPTVSADNSSVSRFICRPVYNRHQVSSAFLLPTTCWGAARLTGSTINGCRCSRCSRYSRCAASCWCTCRCTCWHSSWRWRGCVHHWCKSCSG